MTLRYSFLILTITIIGGCKTYEEAKLAKQYFPQGKFISLLNHQVFVIEKNSQNSHLTPIVFIHGFSSNVHTWELIFSDTQLSNPMVAIDLLGFGFSDKPNITYDRKLYVDQIHSLLEFYHFDKVILVGNSMGGEISLRYTLNHPEKVSKLVLICSAGLIEGFDAPKIIKYPMVVLLRSTNFLFRNRYSIKFFLSDAFYDKTKVDKRKIDLYTLPLRTKNGYEAHIGLFLSSYQPISLDSLQKIQIPVLIIWGEHDRWIPLEHAYLFYQNLPRAQLVILPEVGHLPQEEDPGVVIFYLKEFINSK
ncbi:MAG: alpha/beta hydrolase [Leptospiraceae bacterium]|nr:alpha/beta hydrolase [Leptospiraceae bacterium]MDW7974988.1 alpha/beta hydrolase [Leptospiraceae bacterium]